MSNKLVQLAYVYGIQRIMHVKKGKFLRCTTIRNEVEEEKAVQIQRTKQYGCGLGVIGSACKKMICVL